MKLSKTNNQKGKAIILDEEITSESSQCEDDDEGSYESDQSEDEDEIEKTHDRLLNVIHKFSQSAELPIEKNNFQQQFSSDSMGSSVVNGGVSLDALLEALDDTKGLSAVKKSLDDLEKNISLPMYVEKVVSERAERTLTYAGTKKDMDKWQDTVITNRHMKTLDLAQDKRTTPSYQNLVKKFVPKTDMEKEIQMVLIKSGNTDKAADENEIDELGGRQLTLKEIREKQAELAKVKALMFYEQLKRHRLNKIKSKAYHRIRNKQKARRNDQNNEEIDENEDNSETQEKNALKRVKERMDLRHKNTGKWSRMAAEHSRGDKSLREAYNQSILLGQELTRRIEDDPLERSEDGSDESDGGGSEGENNKQQKVAYKAAKAMKKVLGEEDVSESSLALSGKYGKLLDMDFMRRAASKQKEKAKEEAQGLLRELIEMENEEAGEADLEVSVVPASAAVRGEDLQAAETARQQIDQLLPSGGSMAMRMPSRRVTVAAAPVQASPDPLPLSQPQAVTAATEPNPWLMPTREKQRGGKKAAAKEQVVGCAIPTAGLAQAHTTEHAVGRAAAAVSTGNMGQAPTTTVPLNAAAVSTKPATTKAERKPFLIQKSQSDLVEEAFSAAGPDYEADFLAHKNKEIDNELGIDQKKMKILSQVKAGWGDWAGPGAAGVGPKTLLKRDRLVKAAEAEALQQKAGRKDTKAKLFNVLLSEKRIKTAAKYKLAAVPHPFTTREEYERSIQMPLGDEWNASHVVRQNTRPEVLLRPGRVLLPVELPKKRPKEQSEAAPAPKKQRAGRA